MEQNVDPIDDSKANHYASQKSVSQNLLNMSVISFHIRILVDTARNDNLDNFDYATITLACLSVVLQLIMFFLLVWLFYSRKQIKYRFLTTTGINGVVTCMSGVALILNVAIVTVSSRL